MSPVEKDRHSLEKSRVRKKTQCASPVSCAWLRYTIVNIMKIYACRAITRMWKTAHMKCKGSRYRPISPMRMKMSSPAYMWPKSRIDSDSGFEMNDTSSRMRLNAMMSGAAMIAMPFVGGAIGWNVNSLPKPIGPLILIEIKKLKQETRHEHTASGDH